MIDRYQITFKANVIKNYPVTQQLCNTLSGSERARTIMAVIEAFAMMEGMQGADPRALYHHAKELLLGYNPKPTDAQTQLNNPRAFDGLSPVATNEVRAQQDAEFIDTINKSLDNL